MISVSAQDSSASDPDLTRGRQSRQNAARCDATSSEPVAAPALIHIVRSQSIMKSTAGSLMITLLFLGLINAIAASANSQADTVAQTRDKWLAAFKSKEVASAVAFYASDAAFLQPTGDRIEGRKAIRELYEKVVSTFDTNLTLINHSLEASGDLAYDSGEYEETLTNRATAQKEYYRGQYLMVFRLGPEGQWRIIQHVWTVVPSQT